MPVGEGRVAIRQGSCMVEARPGRLWARAASFDVESKRVDEFANMSDEELRQYVYGNKEGVLFRLMGRSVDSWQRRGRGVLVGEGRVSFRDVDGR